MYYHGGKCFIELIMGGIYFIGREECVRSDELGEMRLY